ncbi:hypothetical protein GCM10010302_19630 [Streptomyces polychromogenes]|uniref:Uncharacterized protein n=1 Tax=Streptomyces polychromogenes TaxID=67342 RepID=A0ABP3EWB6_9ACTN
MSHHVHTPNPAPAKRRMFRYTMVLTSAAFIAGGIASLATPHASAATAPRAPAVQERLIDNGPTLIGVPGR